MAEEPKKDRLINTVIGKCLLLKKIGKGGMGDVYLAQHQFLQKKVAVKVLPADFTRSPEFVARFHREAIAAAKLEHPNIVQVHDIGDENECYYIVMSYVEGKTLQEILDERKEPMDPMEAARIAGDIAKGLKAAHEQGIVHRDIKPSNIMLSEKGEVKIMDFGLAFDADSGTQLTRAGAIMGTPHFISPEQADGKRADERSDLYSLGVVFYYMATGVKPFTGESTMAILYKHLNQMPEPPSKVNPKIPSHMAAMIVKLLAKKPENRYQCSEEFVKDVESFIANPVKRPSAAVQAVSARKSASMRALEPQPLRRAKPATDPNIKRPRLPFIIGGGVLGVTILAVILAVALGGRKDDPKPDGGGGGQKPPPKDNYAEFYTKGLERENEGKYEEALGFFKQALASRDTPDLRKAIERVEAHIEKQLDEELWKLTLETQTEKAFQDYLAKFPKGSHAGEAEKALQKIKDEREWKLESDYTEVFVKPETMRICGEHLNPGLAFDGKLVEIDTARSGAGDVRHYLWHDDYTIADFVFRGEIYLERGKPALMGHYVLKDLAEPGRPNGIAWDLDIPTFAWVPFELSIANMEANATVNGKKLPSRSLLSNYSRYGAVGFMFWGSDRLKLRRMRIKVTKREDLAEVKKRIEEEKKKNLEHSEIEKVQNAIGAEEVAQLRKRTTDPVRKKVEAIRVDLRTDRGIKEYEAVVRRVEACEKVIAGFLGWCKAQSGKNVEIRTKSGLRKGLVKEVAADHVTLGAFQVPLQEVLADEMVNLAQISGEAKLLDQVLFLLVEGAAKPLMDKMIIGDGILAGTELWVGELVDVVVADVEGCVRDKRTKDAEALVAQIRKIEGRLSADDRQKVKVAADAAAAGRFEQARVAAVELLKRDKTRGRDELIKIIKDPAAGPVVEDAARNLYGSIMEDPWTSGFNGRDLKEWKVDPAKDAKVEPGEIVVNSDAVTLTPTSWAKNLKGVAAHVWLEEHRGLDGAGFAWTYKDRDNHRRVSVTKEAVQAVVMEGGKARVLGSRPETPVGKWMHVVVLEVSELFLVFVNGELLYKSDTKTESIGSGVFLITGASAKLKDIRYRR